MGGFSLGVIRHGYGDGHGDGDGYGYGHGDGDGNEEARTVYFDAMLEAHEKAGTAVAFWRSTEDGKPANGGSGAGRKVGTVERIEGPLKICTKNALHGTHNPSQWKGERWWVVRLKEPVQIDGDKIASLEREIVADLGKCPF